MYRLLCGAYLLYQRSNGRCVQSYIHLYAVCLIVYCMHTEDGHIHRRARHTDPHQQAHIYIYTYIYICTRCQYIHTYTHITYSDAWHSRVIRRTGAPPPSRRPAALLSSAASTPRCRWGPWGRPRVEYPYCGWAKSISQHLRNPGSIRSPP